MSQIETEKEHEAPHRRPTYLAENRQNPTDIKAIATTAARHDPPYSSEKKYLIQENDNNERLKKGNGTAFSRQPSKH